MSDGYGYDGIFETSWWKSNAGWQTHTQILKENFVVKLIIIQKLELTTLKMFSRIFRRGVVSSFWSEVSLLQDLILFNLLFISHNQCFYIWKHQWAQDCLPRIVPAHDHKLWFYFYYFIWICFYIFFFKDRLNKQDTMLITVCFRGDGRHFFLYFI